MEPGHEHGHRVLRQTIAVRGSSRLPDVGAVVLVRHVLHLERLRVRLSDTGMEQRHRNVVFHRGVIISILGVIGTYLGKTFDHAERHKPYQHGV